MELILLVPDAILFNLINLIFGCVLSCYANNANISGIFLETINEHNLFIIISFFLLVYVRLLHNKNRFQQKEFQ